MYQMIKQIAENNGFKAEITSKGVIVSLTSRKVYAWEIEMMFEAEDAPIIVQSINGKVIVS